MDKKYDPLEESRAILFKTSVPWCHRVQCHQQEWIKACTGLFNGTEVLFPCAKGTLLPTLDHEFSQQSLMLLHYSPIALQLAIEDTMQLLACRKSSELGLMRCERALLARLTALPLTTPNGSKH
eukprot:4593966-Amphidinium_carterae.1